MNSQQNDYESCVNTRSLLAYSHQKQPTGSESNVSPPELPCPLRPWRVRHVPFEQPAPPATFADLSLTPGRRELTEVDAPLSCPPLLRGGHVPSAPAWLSRVWGLAPDCGDTPPPLPAPGSTPFGVRRCVWGWMAGHPRGRLTAEVTRRDSSYWDVSVTQSSQGSGNGPPPPSAEPTAACWHLV